MAPWSSRRGAQPKDNSNNHSSGDLISRIHHSALHTPTTLSATQENRFDISFSNAHDGADSSDSDADFYGHPPQSSAASHSRPSSRSRHSRSMSQPFPSLFSSKKKRQSSVGAPPPPDLGFADDDAAMPQRLPARSHTRGGPAGSKDFATGNCMTCGSLVRWPRDLKVFKCTICMTVNDIEPLKVDGQTNGGSSRRRDATQGPSNGPQPAPPRIQYISVEHTRRLVQQCIHSYLSRKLTTPAPSRTPENHHPPRHNLSFSNRVHANGHGPAPEDAELGPTSPPIYVSQFVFDEQPTLHPSPRPNSPATGRSYSTSHTERPYVRNELLDDARKAHERNGHRRSTSRSPDSDPKRIFKALEDYIIACFSTFECINSSFTTPHHRHNSRGASETVRRKPASSIPPPPQREPPRVPRETPETHEPREQPQQDPAQFDLDPKLLLLGDFAENGTWWTGGQEKIAPAPKSPPVRHNSGSAKSLVHPKSPLIHWGT